MTATSSTRQTNDDIMKQNAQFTALVEAAERQLQQLEAMLPECRKYKGVRFGFSSKQLLKEISTTAGNSPGSTDRGL